MVQTNAGCLLDTAGLRFPATKSDLLPKCHRARNCFAITAPRMAQERRGKWNRSTFGLTDRRSAAPSHYELVLR